MSAHLPVVIPAAAAAAGCSSAQLAPRAQPRATVDASPRRSRRASPPANASRVSEAAHLPNLPASCIPVAAFTGTHADTCRACSTPLQSHPPPSSRPLLASSCPPLPLPLHLHLGAPLPACPLMSAYSCPPGSPVQTHRPCLPVLRRGRDLGACARPCDSPPARPVGHRTGCPTCGITLGDRDGLGELGPSSSRWTLGYPSRVHSATRIATLCIPVCLTTRTQ